MTRIGTLFAAAVWLVAPGWGPSAEPLLIDLAGLPHKPSDVTTKNNAKVPAGTVELVAGQFGKACKFSFVESTGPQFFTAWVNPQEDWNQYEGFGPGRWPRSGRPALLTRPALSTRPAPARKPCSGSTGCGTTCTSAPVVTN